MILCLFWITAKAQNTAEIPAETLPATENHSDEFQNYDPEDLPWHARRFKFTAGAFFPINNTQVEVGSNDGDFGNSIDFEKDLGFNKSSESFTAAFEWRISRRSRLGAEYFYLNRRSTKVLQRDIEFGDHTYPVNGSVSAFFDNQIIRVYYGYAFVSKPKYEIGALIGAHVMLIDVGLALKGETQQLTYNDSFDVTAPLPDIGIWGEFVLGKKVGLYANINYFALKVNDIDGRILSYNLTVLYNMYKNLSITAGYTGLNIRVDAEKERLNGFFKWGYNGPTIALTYSFGKHIQLHK